MKYTLISPSKLALQSVNQPPVGYESKIDGACILCGFKFHPGDLIVDANIPDTFTNHYDLGAPNSRHLCGYCAVTNNKPWTQAWMSSVITKDGLYKFASNNDIAHWLLNPPEPPFVMMRGDQQIQHLIWRTPVNYNREVYQVRMGEKLLTIRRAHLVEANAALHRISDRLIAAANAEKASAKQKKNKGKLFVLPFIRPVRDLDDVNAGQLRHDVLSLAKESGDQQFAADIEVINRSTPGELWALSILPYSEPVTSLNKHEVKL